MKKLAVPYPLVALAIAAITALILLLMGQPAICTCGRIDLWAPGASGPTTSQMLADWYSPSHVIHGFLFYGLMHLVWRRASVEKKFIAALLLEGRQRSRSYVAQVVRNFRAAVDALDAGLPMPEGMLARLSEGQAMTTGAYKKTWR